MSQAERFQVRIVGPQVWDARSDNVDVEVTLADGRRFGATFFTLDNINRLFEKNRISGECAGGLYLWAADMILVHELTLEAIQKTVESLIANDELAEAFSELTS